MSLGERLNQLRRTRAIVRLPRPMTDLKVERSYEALATKYDRVGLVSGVDYERLASKLHSAAQFSSMGSLSPRELRLAASCLFDPKYHLADDDNFLGQYLVALQAIRSRMAVRRLIYTYCIHFDPSRQPIRRIARFLQEEVFKITGLRDWSERHRQYKVFDPSEAPRELAKQTFDSIEPRRVLNDLGFSGQLAVEGLAAHTFLSALSVIQARISSDPTAVEVDRAIAWVRSDDGELLFSKYRGALANSLLLPFLDQYPDRTLQLKIQNFLLDNFGDPRIERRAWLGSDEIAKNVLIRWLAQATLEQFLKVVDRVAPKHQWDDRRAFWGAYIDKGMVANAWVAFGNNGARVARQISESTTDSLMRHFATLRDASADHAVLLLGIGDLIIADWSHDGRLRIWRKGNQSAPEFSVATYAAADLRIGSDFETVHLPPGGWQGKAEAYIRRQTGIRLIESEYLPSRRRR